MLEQVQGGNSHHPPEKRPSTRKFQKATRNKTPGTLNHTTPAATPQRLYVMSRRSWPYSQRPSGQGNRVLGGEKQGNPTVHETRLGQGVRLKLWGAQNVPSPGVLLSPFPRLPGVPQHQGLRTHRASLVCLTPW